MVFWTKRFPIVAAIVRAQKWMMIGALLRNSRILACLLLGACVAGGMVWYNLVPDVIPPWDQPELPASLPSPVYSASGEVTKTSRGENEVKAAKLFEIADSSGLKRAFDQLEAEFPPANMSRARVWFALKSIIRDPERLPDVLALLKNLNERAEVLFAGASRLIRENKLKPEALDRLGLSDWERGGVQRSIATVLAEDGRISEALEIVHSMAKSDNRSGTLSTVVENVARADTTKALAMVKTLGDDDRGEARSVLISVFREKGCADGLRSMLQDSQDDAEKQRLVFSIVKAYGSYRDNVSASQFVDSLDSSLKEAGRKALGETFR